MKQLHSIHSAAGRRIHTVYDSDHGWAPYPTETRFPPENKMPNFDLEFVDKEGTARSILCLDNYGNELMAESLHKSIFCGQDYFDFLLGIDRQSFELYRVSFSIEKKKLVASYGSLVPFQDLDLHVPVKYRSRIDELKSAKRPWYATLMESSLFDLHEREIGLRDLPVALVVDLDFHPYRVQVSGEGSWRELSNWKSGRT